MPRSGIARSYGKDIFSFLRKHHNLFHCINFIPTNHVTGFLFITTFPAFIICRCFLVMAILTGVRWYLIVVLIAFLSLVMLSIFSCAFWPSVCRLWRNVCLEKYLFRSSAHFLMRFFFYSKLQEVFIHFYRLIPCQLLHLQIFSSLLWAVFSFCFGFPLLCKNFQVELGPIFKFLFLLSLL